MGKFKVLFEGDRAVVIQLRDGVKAQDLVNEGVLVQKSDGLYTRDNKKVIISESGFFLMSKPRLVDGIGGCGGSVYEVLKSVVISAGHVLECSDKLVVGNKSYRLGFKRIRYLGLTHHGFGIFLDGLVMNLTPHLIMVMQVLLIMMGMHITLLFPTPGQSM